VPVNIKYSPSRFRPLPTLAPLNLFIESRLKKDASLLCRIRHMMHQGEGMEGAAFWEARGGGIGTLWGGQEGGQHLGRK